MLLAGLDVSIHAHHYWRAIRDFAAHTAHLSFVSIHAHHYWRAIQGDKGDEPAHEWFQSTPTITGGRFAKPAALPALVAGFNPRPPLLAGDSTLDTIRERIVEVSIHAHHYWRAIHCQATLDSRQPQVSIHAHHYWRAIRQQPIANSQQPKVSIHAHHYWRAIPDAAVLAGLVTLVSIHAHHYWRAIRCKTRRARSWKLFQSTPTITGGRFFVGFDHTGCDVDVSIHAHHYWRAIPL